MNKNLGDSIYKSALEMEQFCGESDMFSKEKNVKLPSKDVIIGILKDLRKVIFPGYFGSETLETYGSFANYTLCSVSERLTSQIRLVIGGEEAEALAEATQLIESGLGEE